MPHFTTLIDANTLSRQLDREDLTLFDCRFDLANTSWGETEYARAHLPGALYLHLDRDLSSSITATSGRHPLPDPERFAARLGELGVTRDSQIVAYDQGNGAYGARFWWLARWIGLRNVAVLDGGIQAWTAAGHELSQDEPRLAPAELRLGSEWHGVIERDELAGRLGAVKLLDARAHERYIGATEPIDPVPGHIPTARNVPWARAVADDGSFKKADQLSAIYRDEVGLKDDDSVIAYCRIGERSSHTWFVLTHLLGFGNVRNYDGSWTEWGSAVRVPIVKGPEPGTLS